jgi:hypothetical protein
LGFRNVQEKLEKKDHDIEPRFWLAPEGEGQLFHDCAAGKIEKGEKREK